MSMRQPGSRTTTSASDSARSEPASATALTLTTLPGGWSGLTIIGTSTTTPSGSDGCGVYFPAWASPGSVLGAHAGPPSSPARAGSRSPRQEAGTVNCGPSRLTVAVVPSGAPATTTLTTWANLSPLGT